MHIHVLDAVMYTYTISALGSPALLLILVTRVDTSCDTDFVMYYSLFVV